MSAPFTEEEVIEFAANAHFIPVSDLSRFISSEGNLFQNLTHPVLILGQRAGQQSEILALILPTSCDKKPEDAMTLGLGINYEYLKDLDATPHLVGGSQILLPQKYLKTVIDPKILLGIYLFKKQNGQEKLRTPALAVLESWVKENKADEFTHKGKTINAQKVRANFIEQNGPYNKAIPDQELKAIINSCKYNITEFDPDNPDADVFQAAFSQAAHFSELTNAWHILGLGDKVLCVSKDPHLINKITEKQGPIPLSTLYNIVVYNGRVSTQLVTLEPGEIAVVTDKVKAVQADRKAQQREDMTMLLE